MKSRRKTSKGSTSRTYKIKTTSISRSLTKDEAVAAKKAIQKKYPKLTVSIVNA